MESNNDKGQAANGDDSASDVNGADCRSYGKATVGKCQRKARNKKQVTYIDNGNKNRKQEAEMARSGGSKLEDIIYQELEKARNQKKWSARNDQKCRSNEVASIKDEFVMRSRKTQKILSLEEIIQEEMKKNLEEKQKSQCTELVMECNIAMSEHCLRALLEKEINVNVKLSSHVVRDRQTSCILEFPSKRKRKEFIEKFKKTRLLDMGLRIVENNAVFTKDWRDDLRKERGFVESNAQLLLSGHEEKITEVRREIKEITEGRHCGLSILDQLPPLENKVEELQSQKREFVIYLNRLLEKYDEIDNEMSESRYRSKVEGLRAEFRAEISKFSSCLPIYARRSEIIKCLRDNHVSVIIGETGSGKSTQLTQYLSEVDFTKHGEIVCTQPRKVAAMTLAQRVAQEVNTRVGHLVGYKVGSLEKRRKETRITYVTDDVLLNECITDPELKRYSCIIIDEAHERSIYTDLLLGMIKKALEKRPDLRLVITSATIDPQVFVDYFDGCPLISVSGRTFPVEVDYENDPGQISDGPSDYLNKAVDKVMWIHRHRPIGDILVFLTAPKETEKATELTEKRVAATEMLCLQLHGQQAAKDQQKVFQSTNQGQRKVVFATNCAETSITIPGIKYVVDCGLSKEKQFDGRKNMTTLKMCYVSKSSADQRKGRAGRMEPGECYRLYSEHVYDEMRSTSTPEILRTHLGQSLLKLMLLGVRNPADFDFVQPPPRDSLRAAQQSLEELGAVDSEGLTELGQNLAQLSLEPRLGKLVLAGIDADIGTEVIVMAALAGVGYNIFFRGKTKDEQAKSDKNKIKLSEFGGDVLTALSVFNEWGTLPEKQKQAWCMANSLNGRWLKTAREDIKELLKVLRSDLGFNVKYKEVDVTKVKQCLPAIIASCYSANICHFTGHSRIGYSPINNLDEVYPIHPSSILSHIRSEPDWIVFESILCTSQQFLINVTALTEEEAMREVEVRGLLSSAERAKLSRIERVEVPGIGSTVKKELVRKRYGSLVEMEKQLRGRNNSKRIAISDENDTLNLFADPDKIEALMGAIREEAEPFRDTLKKVCREVELIEGTGIRCLLQAGGTLKTVLMPGDSRTIEMRTVGGERSDKNVRELCSRFGTIEDFFKLTVNKGNRKPDCWKVTFADTKSAVAAVKELNKENLGLSAKLCVSNNDPEKIDLYVSFIRRQLKGFGFVHFDDPFQASLIVGRLNCIFVDGERVTVNINKGNKIELYLRGIPRHACVDDIKAAFAAEDISVNDVRLPREKPYPTSTSDLNMFKRKLMTEIGNNVTEQQYEIRLNKPKESDFNVTGYITCTDMEVAEKIAGSNIYINSGEFVSKVHMTIQFRINEFVIKPIYDVKRALLRQLLRDLAQSGTPVKSEVLNNGCFRFNVRVSNLEQLRVYKARISEVLQPQRKRLYDARQCRRLMSGTGKNVLEKTMKRHNVYIQYDRWQAVLLLHGEADAVANADEELDEFLRSSADNQVRDIKLTGDHSPPGVLRALFRRYGLDMEKLRSDCGLTDVDVHVRSHVLSMCGSEQALEKCDAILHVIMSGLSQTIQTTDSDEPQCPVCLSPPDENIYRTEYCGHVYCRSCIDGLVLHAIRNKSLPVTCIKEDCEEKLTIQDFLNILGKTSRALEELCNAAKEKFVLENKTMYSYCITPDCPVIYKTTRTKHRFVCPNTDCQANICTSCKEKYHEGQSCAMYQGMKNDEDYGIKAWMKQSPENRAPCPRCGQYIEKNGGCMHMTCKCGAHICWRCKKVFSSADETYNHQITCQR